jgi:hypothetical protein
MRRKSDSPDSDKREPQGDLVPAEPAPSALDAYGFDPADYEWVPVLRKRRSDGWTPQRQVDFIAALADTGCVAEAARIVGMSVMSCYRLRRAPGAENFAAAWDAALQQAARKLVDIAFDRAIHGSDEPVFDKDGRRVGRRMRTNDRLLMFLLGKYMPERFGRDRDARRPEGSALPALPPVAEALRALEPVQPPDPHLLMPPDELGTALEVADIFDGELPHWHLHAVPAEPAASPLGEAFERELEAAKREAAGLPPKRAGEEDGDDDDPFLA